MRMLTRAFTKPYRRCRALYRLLRLRVHRRERLHWSEYLRREEERARARLQRRTRVPVQPVSQFELSKRQRY